MTLLTVGPLGTQTISQSETDTVNFTGVGTLNIVGTPQAPIDVTLSQYVTAGIGSTINMSYAHVRLNGVAGLSAAMNYNIGEGATLEIQSGVGIAAGSTTAFTGTTGHFVVNSLVNLPVASSFSGFGPGKTIDLTSLGVARIAYTDNGGSNTGGTLTLYNASNNSLGSIALSTGEYVASNFGLIPDGGSGTILNFTSIVTGLTTTPGTATLGPNATVGFTVSMSNPIAITGGVPTLTLNDGGTAIYNPAASTSSQLAFTYTVAAGQNTTDLAVTGVALNGATLATIGGGGVNLLGAVLNPAGTLAIDTIAPIVTSTVISQPNGILAAGATVSFALSLSEAVSLGSGTPVLLLNDGGTATLDSANSTPTSLIFRHTVQPGQNSTDLAIVGVSLNNAAVRDVAGNLLNLAGAIGNPAGTLVVDTLAPSVNAVSTSPGAGTLTSGQTVTFSVGLTEAVFLAGGTPTLLLNDGGVATYDAANSTPTMLVFSHVIQPGQSAADLAILGSSLNGAVISDLAGNALNLAGAIGNPAGLLAISPTLPTGTLPTGTPPTSTLPTSTLPTGTLPTGTLPTGTLPTGTFPTGTFPTGTSTPDTNPAGGTAGAPTGTSPATAPLSVFRFFDSNTGTHFYTTNPNERDTILRTRPDLVSEGVGLNAVNDPANDPNAREVFRFFDTVHGTQFLTASSSERDEILATRPDLTFEPQGSFFEHIQPQANDTPVYRFFSASDGTHFYTDSVAERANIVQTRPDLIAEGVGFYEPR